MGGRNPLFIKSEFSQGDGQSRALYAYQDVAILYSSSQNSLKKRVYIYSYPADYAGRNPLFIKSEFSQGDGQSRALYAYQDVAILYSSSQNSLLGVNNTSMTTPSLMGRNPLFIKSEFSRAKVNKEIAL